MLRGLAGALAGSFTPQGGGQVLPDVLPLSLLDVVLGRSFQVRLHLQEQNFSITSLLHLETSGGSGFRHISPDNSGAIMVLFIALKVLNQVEPAFLQPIQPMLKLNVHKCRRCLSLNNLHPAVKGTRKTILTGGEDMKSRTSSTRYGRRIDYERFCIRDEALQTLLSNSESTTGHIKPPLIREPVQF